jgi:hypothetical protein
VSAAPLSELAQAVPELPVVPELSLVVVVPELPPLQAQHIEFATKSLSSKVVPQYDGFVVYAAQLSPSLSVAPLSKSVQAVDPVVSLAVVELLGSEVSLVVVELLESEAVEVVVPPLQMQHIEFEVKSLSS